MLLASPEGGSMRYLFRKPLIRRDNGGAYSLCSHYVRHQLLPLPSPLSSFSLDSLGRHLLDQRSLDCFFTLGVWRSIPPFPHAAFNSSGVYCTSSHLLSPPPPVISLASRPWALLLRICVCVYACVTRLLNQSL